MARRAIRSSKLETAHARLKLPVRPKPYYVTVAPGISLGYRAGPGSWNVRAADGAGGNWLKSFAIADDREDSDGEKVLTYWEAQQRARKFARGQDGDASRPATVAEALDIYKDDLIARGGNPANATGLCNHVSPAMLSKPVGITTAKEWRAARDAMRKRVKGATVNRNCKALKAALNLAAKLDPRIINRQAWRDGLSAVAENNSTECNIVLDDAERRALVAAAYAISPEFGLYVEVHAIGARTSQIALLDVGDLQMNGGAARLMVPSSLKGRNRTTRTRKPVPIPPGLAKRLHAAAKGRSDGEPLLRRSDGQRWQPNNDDHHKLFAQAREAAKLGAEVTAYSLRHSSITKMLLAGVPVRVVASLHDTSVAMIEKTYSKFIADHSDALIRRAMFEADAPAAGRNVVPMR